MTDSVRAFAPATVANVGPGFDVLGLAVASPGDVVMARRTSGADVIIEAIRGDGGKLSLDPAKNTAGIAARATLARAGISAGIALQIEKGLPLGSGLGSSAASAAAAALAVNTLLGSPLRRLDLVEPCLDAEEAVSGRHADNVAAALLGGLVLVRSLDPLDLVRLPIPEGLWIALSTPSFELSTREARAVLPPSIPLSAAVKRSADLAAFVSACHSGDLALLARCICDEVVNPVRAALIPGATEALASALRAGALGASISGAGPSLFALCRSPRSAAEAGASMAAAFRRAGLDSSTMTSPVDCPGARTL